MPSKAAVLRRLLRGPGPLRVAGAHDAIGARLAELHGFDAIWASGLEITTSHGVPDDGRLPMTDFLWSARHIDRSVLLPVIADCDTGFGGPEAVFHAAREYGVLGIAGICIEDQAAPKRNSLDSGGHGLLPIAAFEEKIAAALAGRGDTGLVVFARVEAFVAGAGLEEALRRATAYADVGADVIVIHSKRSDPSEVAAFLRAWPPTVPVALIPTTYGTVRTAQLHEMGAQAVIFANQGLRASLTAVSHVWELIRSSDEAAAADGVVASIPELLAFNKRDRSRAWQETGNDASSSRTARCGKASRRPALHSRLGRSSPSSKP